MKHLFLNQEVSLDQDWQIKIFIYTISFFKRHFHCDYICSVGIIGQNVSLKTCTGTNPKQIIDDIEKFIISQIQDLEKLIKLTHLHIFK